MGAEVFISCHTDTSVNIVEAIVQKLENKEIKCWYAQRDVSGNYAGNIASAIKECKVFVLILNREASESPHVLNELDIVTKRLSNKENVVVIPFHTANDGISPDADYYVGRMHWIDGVTPPFKDRITELTQKIEEVLRLEFNQEKAQSEPDKKDIDAQQETEVNNSDKKTTKTYKIKKNLYIDMWKKCFVYKGTAGRKEYFSALAIHLIVCFVIVCALPSTAGVQEFQVCMTFMSVPVLSLSARRLHDAGMSGHWQWLDLTGYGAVAVFVFLCKKTKYENNKYRIKNT